MFRWHKLSLGKYPLNFPWFPKNVIFLWLLTNDVSATLFFTSKWILSLYCFALISQYRCKTLGLNYRVVRALWPWYKSNHQHKWLGVESYYKSFNGELCYAYDQWIEIPLIFEGYVETGRRNSESYLMPLCFQIGTLAEIAW